MDGHAVTRGLDWGGHGGFEVLLYGMSWWWWLFAAMACRGCKATVAGRIVERDVR